MVGAAPPTSPLQAAWSIQPRPMVQHTSGTTAPHNPFGSSHMHLLTRHLTSARGPCGLLPVQPLTPTWVHAIVPTQTSFCKCRTVPPHHKLRARAAARAGVVPLRWLQSGVAKTCGLLSVVSTTQPGLAGWARQGSSCRPTPTPAMPRPRCILIQMEQPQHSQMQETSHSMACAWPAEVSETAQLSGSNPSAVAEARLASTVA